MNFWFELLQSILQIAIAPTTAAFVLAAIGLNVHFGFTGLMNMGQAGFMLVGAYGFGVSVSYFGSASGRPSLSLSARRSSSRSSSAFPR